MLVLLQATLEAVLGAVVQLCEEKSALVAFQQHSCAEASFKPPPAPPRACHVCGWIERIPGGTRSPNRHTRNKCRSGDRDCGREVGVSTARALQVVLAALRHNADTAAPKLHMHALRTLLHFMGAPPWAPTALLAPSKAPPCQERLKSGSAPTCHRKQPILVIRNRREKADSGLAV